MSKNKPLLQKIPLFERIKANARATYKNKKIADAIALRLYWRKKQEGSK